MFEGQDLRSKQKNHFRDRLSFVIIVSLHQKTIITFKKHITSAIYFLETISFLSHDALDFVETKKRGSM
jgi:hypothetical protein